MNAKTHTRMLLLTSCSDGYEKKSINYTDFLKSVNIDYSAMYFLPFAEREEFLKNLTNEYLRNNPNHFKVAEIVISSNFGKREKTKSKTFNELNKLNEWQIRGKSFMRKCAYNQFLQVTIESIREVSASTDTIRFYHTQENIMFTDKEYDTTVVSNRGCVIGVCCYIEDDILYIGKNAQCFKNGKEISPFVFYRELKGFRCFNGKNMTLPKDLDILRFNFNYYKSEENIATGNYIKKNEVSIAKTDKENFVLCQYNPTRRIVVLKNGEIIQKNDAEFGNAEEIQTNYTSFDKHKEIIEYYERIMAERREEERKAKEKILSEMYAKAEGWYIIELPCYQYDHYRGGHKERWTNWKILASSKMDAYNKACEAAEKKGFYWFREAIKCQIDFFGIWTDEKEMILREEGLI